MTATNSGGAVLIARLKALGVDWIFANSGTDFPPIIEGYAEARAEGTPVPKAITVPHETAAVALAHGAYFATRQPQAVMVHTNVGLANAAIGAINARADNVPMLVFSGRTPTTEKGRFGSRSVPIGWGQEMRDQTALVREACKWDYELRLPEQVAELVDRAHGIATSVPRGPVYISLPREVLCEQVAATDAPPLMRAGVPVARSADIERAAALIAGARHPVIIAQRGAGTDAAFAALSELAETWAIPVCQYWAVQIAVPTDHPMATGPDPAPLLEQADVIVVLDALAPWAPDAIEPRAEATVIQIGQDPLFAQTPIRNFRSDLSLPGDLGENILALAAALGRWDPADRTERRDRIARANAESWAARDALVARDGDGPVLTKRWISAEIARAAQRDNTTVFGELGAQLAFMRLDRADAWFESPHAGGLGFGFPAALGYKLARPESTVIATVGDGSYIFANPVACHQLAEAQGISLLIVVLNNAEWGAVRASVAGLYPDGHAVAANTVPLTDLSPAPDFATIAAASRAWSTSVDTPAAFRTALEDGLAHVTAKRGLALIDARVARD